MKPKTLKQRIAELKAKMAELEKRVEALRKFILQFEKIDSSKWN